MAIVLAREVSMDWKDGEGFYFTSRPWLRTTDVDELTQEIYIAANTVSDLVELLRPLIEQSNQTKL